MTNDDREERGIQFIRKAVAEAQRKSKAAREGARNATLEAKRSAIREAQRNAARKAARKFTPETANEPVVTYSKLDWKHEKNTIHGDDELIVGAASIAKALGKDWDARRVRYYHGKGYLPTEKLGQHIVVWRSQLMGIMR